MTRRQIVAALILVAVGVAWWQTPGAAELWARIHARLGDWQSFAGDHPVRAVAMFAVVYIAVAALSLPVTPLLTMTAGALFGRWFGAGLSAASATLGGCVAFSVSRYLFAEGLRQRYGERLRTMEAEIARGGAAYLLTLRLMPVVPYWLVNLLMGLTPMRLRTFAAVSLVGMLPGSFVYANLGTSAARVESFEGLVSWEVFAALALLAVVPLALRWALRRTEAGAKP